jgi:hypothetical protein
MLKNRNEFICDYWKYYCVLENEFIELIKYIDLRKSNFGTTSDTIIKQLQSVCSEFEIICKEFSDINMNEKNVNITDYYDGIIQNSKDILKESNIDNIQDVHIIVKNTKNMIISPFENWKEKEPWELFWWKNYNKIKHSRTINYNLGNFESLLNALSALYVMEMLTLKKIFKETGEMDIPDVESKMFYIKNWKTKFLDSHSQFLEIVDEWDNE